MLERFNIRQLYLTVFLIQGEYIELKIGVALGISTMAGKMFIFSLNTYKKQIPFSPLTSIISTRLITELSIF
jgi:hypothetical protein